MLKHDLKPKTEFVIKVALTPLQIRQYTLFVESLQDDTNEVSNARMWSWLDHLHLLCCHPRIFVDKLCKKREEKMAAEKTRTSTEVGQDNTTINEASSIVPEITAGMVDRQVELFNTSGADEFEKSHKMNIISMILRECKAIGDQVLIFSQHLPVLDYLQAFIRAKLPRIDACRLDGSTKAGDRVAMANAVNRGKHDVLLVSTNAGGLGLNITGANRVIIADFSWNPSSEAQAVGRAYRIGQQKAVYVYHLVMAGTFEEAVYNKTIFKTQMASRVVDKKNPERMARNSKDYLFVPRAAEQEDLSAHVGHDSVLDAVLASEVGASIRSLLTAETLQRESDERLTEEEQREVDELYRDEALRISDPAAFARKHQGLLATHGSSALAVEQMRLFSEAAARAAAAAVYE